MHARLALVWLALLGSVAAPSAAALRTLHDDFTNPRTVRSLDPVSGQTSVPSEVEECFAEERDTLFTIFDIGFISGMAHDGNKLYVLEWDRTGSPPDIRLAEIRVSQVGCYEARNPVGISANVGFFELESLAYCEADDSLYSVDFDELGSPHRGQLIRISRATGVGEAVAPGTFLASDRRVVGLACDANGVLWGVTSGFASLAPELLTIDRATGVETLVGVTGTAASSVEAPQIEALAIDDEGELLAAGASLWDVDETSGQATQRAGVDYPTVWGFTALAVPEPGGAAGELAACAALVLARRRRVSR